MEIGIDQIFTMVYKKIVMTVVIHSKISFTKLWILRGASNRLILYNGVQKDSTNDRCNTLKYHRRIY